MAVDIRTRGELSEITVYRSGHRFVFRFTVSDISELCDLAAAYALSDDLPFTAEDAKLVIRAAALVVGDAR